MWLFIEALRSFILLLSIILVLFAVYPQEMANSLQLFGWLWAALVLLVPIGVTFLRKQRMEPPDSEK